MKSGSISPCNSLFASLSRKLAVTNPTAYAMTDANALTCYNFDNSDRLSPVSESAGSIFYSHDLADNVSRKFGNNTWV
jgi:hypothetical protein